MKIKCIALRVSLVILVVSLLITFFWQLHCPNSLNNNLYGYGYALLIGIVSSSFVTTLIYSVEYFAAKKQSLESYAFEIISILNKLLRIKCFSTKEPLSIVTQYLSEQQHNEVAIFQRNQVSLMGHNVNLEDEPFCISTVALKNWQMCFLECQELLDCSLDMGLLEAVNNIIKKEITSYKNEAEAIIHEYYEPTKYSFDVANMLIDDIQFFSDVFYWRTSKIHFLRPRKWDNIYFHIHKPIQMILNGEDKEDINGLKNVCYHLKNYKYEEIDLSTAMLMINDFQNREFVFTDMNSKEQTKYKGLHKFCKVIESQIGRYLLKDFEKDAKGLA